MKLSIKNVILLFILVFSIIPFRSFKVPNNNVAFSLTLKVKELRNSEGMIIFVLYNREDTFPDEHFKKFLQKITRKIQNGTSSVSQLNYMKICNK